MFTSLPVEASLHIMILERGTLSVDRWSVLVSNGDPAAQRLS